MTRETDLIAQLERVLADVASSITNRAIAADPELKDRLMPLAGRTIELQCTVPRTTWYLLFEQEGLNLKAGAADHPTVVIKGDAIALLRWLFQQDSAGLTIEGDDVTLLQAVATLRTYDPELSQTLTQILGDDLSQRLLGGAEAGLRGLKSVVQGVGAGIEQQTSQRFVRRENLDDLLTTIDDLRLRVDRLAANVRAKENPR